MLSDTVNYDNLKYDMNTFNHQYISQYNKFKMPDGKIVILNPNGEKAFDDVDDIILSKKNKFAIIKRAHKFSLYDGKKILIADCDTISEENKDIFYYTQNGKMGVINNLGEVYLKPIYHKIVACTNKNLPENYVDRYHDRYNEEMGDDESNNHHFEAEPFYCFTVKNDSVYGLVDQKNKVLVPIQYKYFSKSIFGNDSELKCYSSNFRYKKDVQSAFQFNIYGLAVFPGAEGNPYSSGLIDTLGKFVVKPIYMSKEFQENVAYNYSIEMDSAVAVASYEDAPYPVEDYAYMDAETKTEFFQFADSLGKTYVYTPNGKFIFADHDIHNIKESFDDNFIVHYNNETSLLIDSTGKHLSDRINGFVTFADKYYFYLFDEKGKVYPVDYKGTKRFVKSYPFLTLFDSASTSFWAAQEYVKNPNYTNEFEVLDTVVKPTEYNKWVLVNTSGKVISKKK